MVSSTPPSFVKSYSKVLSFMIACVTSTPHRDHVPDERYAQLFSPAGTAATAEAVSCEPTAMTGMGPQ